MGIPFVSRFPSGRRRRLLVRLSLPFYERERQVKATKWVIRPMCRPPLCSLPPPEKKKKFFFLESQFLVFYIEGDPFYIHFHSKEEKHRPSEATGLSLYPRPNNISSDQSISGEPKKRSKFFFFLLFLPDGNSFFGLSPIYYDTQRSRCFIMIPSFIHYQNKVIQGNQ